MDISSCPLFYHCIFINGIEKTIQKQLSSDASADRYIREIASSNQEVRYLSPFTQGNLEADYGSTKEDLEIAVKYLRQDNKTFQDLVNEASQLNNSTGLNISSTNLNEINDIEIREPNQFTDEDFNNIAETIDKLRTSENESKEHYQDALQVLFDCIESDEDGFLTNEEIQSKLEAADTDGKIIQDIVENNQEFKFLYIDPRGPGSLAYNGMSKNDLEAALKFLERGDKVFSDLVEEAADLGSGQHAGENRLKASMDQSEQEIEDDKLSIGESRKILDFLAEGIERKDNGQIGIKSEAILVNDQEDGITFLGRNELNEHEQNVLENTKQLFNNSQTLKNTAKAIQELGGNVAIMVETEEPLQSIKFLVIDLH